MITQDEAAIIAEKYLKEKKREYTKLAYDRIQYEEEHKINYGRYEDQKRDIFIVPYETEGYQYPNTYFIVIDIATGEILYTLGGHGKLEMREL